MYLDSSDISLRNPEAWLMLIMYAGFWIYSYYSLAIYLIHTRQNDRSLENIDMEVERNSADLSV